MSGESLIIIVVLILGFAAVWNRMDGIIGLLGGSKVKKQEAQQQHRTTILRSIRNSTESQLGEYLCREFGFRSDDPWIASVLKTRRIAGLDSAVGMVLERKVGSQK